MVPVEFAGGYGHACTSAKTGPGTARGQTLHLHPFHVAYCTFWNWQNSTTRSKQPCIVFPSVPLCKVNFSNRIVTRKAVFKAVLLALLYSTLAGAKTMDFLASCTCTSHKLHYRHNTRVTRRRGDFHLGKQKKNTDMKIPNPETKTPGESGTIIIKTTTKRAIHRIRSNQHTLGIIA